MQNPYYFNVHTIQRHTLVDIQKSVYNKTNLNDNNMFWQDAVITTAMACAYRVADLQLSTGSGSADKAREEVDAVL